MVPHVRLVEDSGEVLVESWSLHIKVQQHGPLPRESQQRGERGRTRPFGGRAVDELRLQCKEVGIGKVLNLAKAIREMVEHVIVEHDEHAIGGAAHIHLAAVGAVVHGRRVGFQGVLGCERAGAAMRE
jgi:hypothetical protein